VADLGLAELGRLFGQVPQSGLPIAIASTGLRHLMVVFASIEVLAGLNPDFQGLSALSHRLRVDTIAAFALTGSGARVRDFCPGIGDNEEAASGTTAGALASYLYQHDELDHGRNIVGLN